MGYQETVDRLDALERRQRHLEDRVLLLEDQNSKMQEQLLSALKPQGTSGKQRVTTSSES